MVTVFVQLIRRQYSVVAWHSLGIISPPIWHEYPLSPL